MGADAEGKHELADDLLLNATVVIDDHEQCTHPPGGSTSPTPQGF